MYNVNIALLLLGNTCIPDSVGTHFKSGMLGQRVYMFSVLINPAKLLFGASLVVVELSECASSFTLTGLHLSCLWLKFMSVLAGGSGTCLYFQPGLFHASQAGLHTEILSQNKQNSCLLL